MVSPTAVSPTAVPALAGWNYRLEEDDLEAAWSWTARLEANGPFETRIAFHYKDPRNYLLLRAAGDGRAATLGFWRVVNGRVEKLGEPEAAVPAGRGQLTVQRSSWRVRALWNGRALVTAFSNLSGARLGTATRGAAALTAARLQPLEPVLRQDDFMRAQGPNDPEMPGEWHRVAGIWKTSGSLGPLVNPNGNPNPFVFRAEMPQTTTPATAAAGSPASALTTIGKWFWSDYTIAVSVRPTLRSLTTPLVAGVAAYRQSDGTRVVGEIDFQSGRAIIKTGPRVLASSAPFEASPGQWHRVFLDPGPGTVRLIVDGVERVRASTQDLPRAATAPGALAQGEAALQATLGGGNFVDFDDVRIGPNQTVSDDFQLGAVGRWDNALGNWQTRAAPWQDRVKLSSGPALTLTGNPEREEGLVEATFKATSKEAAASYPLGVVFAARDAHNYFVARLRAGVLEIVESTGGREKVLARGQALKTKTLPGVSVEWREGDITARSAGTVVTATVTTIPVGRVGAWADGPANAIALTSFHAMGAAPGWGETALPERIVTDPWMKQWASNAASWKQGAGNVWWHTGDFFRDAALSLPLPALANGSGFTVLLGTSATNPTVGAQLALERSGDALQFKLSSGGRVLQTTALPYQASRPAGAGKATGANLRFVRRPLGGGQVSLRVALDGRVLLSQTVTDDKQGKAVAEGATKIGVRLADLPGFKWETVEASTAHLLDYTFTTQPVDWAPHKGRWEIAERWTCQPLDDRFGFFTGSNSDNPTLWSRFALRGDFTLEAYLATPMDQTRGERSPIDLNFTVGDGRDLSSGYSFLFGGKQRRVNSIYRGDRVAVEKPFQLPPVAYDNTHRAWFYVRLERRETPQGLRFRYSVNGREMGLYTDPQPLRDALQRASQLAFWTYNGGLSVARVRLWHSGLEARNEDNGPQEANPAARTTIPASTFKNPLGEWRPRIENIAMSAARLDMSNDDGKRTLRITNPQSGGDWTVFVTRQEFDAAQHPVLRFDYRVPENVLVNLYAKVDGRWREILFSGDPQRLARRTGSAGKPGRPATTAADTKNPPPNAAPILQGVLPGMEEYREPPLGQIAGVVADDKWHTATFNLLAALRKAGWNAAGVTKVEALAIAAPDREYLRAGIGGNYYGAAYWIRDFQAPVVPTSGTPPPTVAAR